MSSLYPITPFDVDHHPVLPKTLNSGNDTTGVDTVVINPPPPYNPPPDDHNPHGGGGDGSGDNPVDPICISAPAYNGSSTATLLQTLAEHAHEKTKADTLAAFAEFAYSFGKSNLVVPDGYSLVYNQIDDSTGFQAVAVRNTFTNDVIIAYAGTDKSSAIDWLNDVALFDALTSNGVTQAPEAINFADHVALLAGNSPIYVTGHSLGGAVAEIGAAQLFAGGHSPVNVSTFGSAPYTSVLQGLGYGGQVANLSSVTNNYNFFNDVLYSLNNSSLFGSNFILNPWDPNGTGGYSIAERVNAHDVANYLKAGNEISGRSCSCGC